MALLSPREAAAELAMTVKTLREHVKDGTIRYIVVGRGKKRPRIAFARADLDEFEETRRRRRAQIGGAKCPSTGRKTRSSITSTSGGEVIGFMARLEAERAEKPNK